MGFLAKLFGNKLVDDVDFKALLESGSRVIDVRNVGEYKEGHGKNALNFPLTISTPKRILSESVRFEHGGPRTKPGLITNKSQLF